MTTIARIASRVLSVGPLIAAVAPLGLVMGGCEERSHAAIAAEMAISPEVPPRVAPPAAPADAVAVQPAPIEPTPATGEAASPADALLLAEGARLFERRGCLACHTVDAREEYSQSTHMAGYFGSTIELQDGRFVVVDEAFVAESIVDTEAARRVGMDDNMPPVQLKQSEVDALVAYIKSLR